MNLQGKTAFVSGAARRLGREIVLHLHHQGCASVVHYNTSSEEALALQTETGCRLFQADFTTTTIDLLLRRLENEVGNVDILINNASSFTRSDWNQVDEKLWDREMAVNLKIPFFLMQFFGNRMKKAGQGKIINMSDIAAEHAYLKYIPYSAAKASILMLTRTFARVLAPEVQVNAIAPGTILFPENTPPETRQNLIDKIPAKRTAEIHEFLKTIDFLLSDVDYITGQVIVLDGGRSLNW